MLLNMATLAQYLATDGIEGIKLYSYDDATGEKLGPGDTPEGTASIAIGLIKYADGSSVQPGDEITLQEAWDETYHYLNTVLMPAFDRLITVDLSEGQTMAFLSWLFNFGETKARAYTLPKLINAQESERSIIDKWMEYVNAGGKPMLGLKRRRAAEVLLWKGLDWRAALNLSWNDDIFDVIEALGGEVERDEDDIFDQLEIPTRGKDVKREKGSDPTPETPVTLDDAQFLNAEAVGYDGTFDEFMAHRTSVTARNAIKVPKVDPKKPPKPMEDSKTHRGLAKKTAGKEGRDMGAILAGAGSMAGAINGLSKDASQTVKNTEPFVAGFTFNHIVIMAIFIGLGLLGYGLWRMFMGERIAREGRESAEQPKI